MPYDRFKPLPWTGRKSRITCPNCDRPQCFRPYVDSETGGRLPDTYGLCDHEQSCGYKLSPYTRPPGGGLSYATAIERNEQPAAASTRFVKVRQIVPSPVLAIPSDVYKSTLGHYERNSLAHLLQQHFGLGVANELLTRFQLGTSSYWLGACIFWLVDEQGRARGGQVVLYDETGHTVKAELPNGEKFRHTRWVHNALAQACERRGQTAPDWLAEYSKLAQKSPCLFGLPQLVNAPPDQPIALVESAKTAMLATPYFPRFIWLATMGLSYLTAERLTPIKGRRIVLFPDAGALDKWQAKATELRAVGFDVAVSEELERRVTPEQRAAGFDLADVLLTEWAGYPPSWDDLPPPPPVAQQSTISPQALPHV